MWDTLCVGNNEAASSASATLHNSASRKMKWDFWASCCVSDCASRCTWEANIQGVLKKLAGGAWAGLIWLRIGTSGRLL